jgi:ABC-type phosphate transport system substrate-binding protein
MTRLFLMATIFLGGASLAADLPFHVVVNDANPVSSLTHDEVSELFLKKRSTWADGGLVLPIDQLEGSQLREIFTRQVHRKSAAAVRAYWQQRIFSGHDVPPPEKDGDAEVIAFVRKNPRAVGYVSASAATAGVKVVGVRR